MKRWAVALGSHTGFIDHLMPLAWLLQMPLLVDNPHLALQAEQYYPSHCIYLTQDPQGALEGSDLLMYAEPARLPYGGFKFGDTIYPKEARSICMLHGSSDKCVNRFWAERYVSEKCLLLYGDHMRHFFASKGVLERIDKVVMCGNFRYLFYQEHQTFFDHLIAPFLFENKMRKTVLYAPTWVDIDTTHEDSSSFFEVYQTLLDRMPEHYQLLVKLHPYYYQLQADRIYEIQNRYLKDDRIRFLPDIPLIYPLLHHVDAFIGDFSSIGFDFLTFDRPLFFLCPTMAAAISHLQKVGKIFQPQDLPKLWSEMDKEIEQLSYSEARQKLYSYTFGSESITLQKLKEILCASI